MDRLTVMDVPMASASRLDGWNDEALMCKVRDDNDIEAFELLVQRYQGAARRVFISYFGRHTDVEDLVQELFFRIFKHRRRYRSQDRFRAWFYRIAMNLAHDQWRQQRRRKKRLLRFFMHQKHEMEYAASAAESTSMMNRGLVHQLEQHIRDLPPRQRQVLILRYVEEMSLNEIAELLGLQVGSVKSTLHHAQRKLKDRLQAVLHSRVNHA